MTMEELSTTSVFSTQPYNLEAEQSVLGAVIIDSSCLPDLMEILKPESFFLAKHKSIFSIYLRMFLSSQVIDFITVLEEVKTEGVFASSDDAKIYLTQLAQIIPSVGNINSYAKIVLEKSYLRNLMSASQSIIEMAQEGSTDATSLLGIAEQNIYDIRQGKEVNGLVRIDEIILETYDRLQKLSGDDKEQFMGLDSGFTGLNSVLTGLNKSDLILLAARPGMGKTSFALNLATNVAKGTGKKVAVFSLEMGKEQLVSRILSSEALISSHSLRTGELSSDEWIRLGMQAQMLSRAPIYIDDSPGISVAQMKGKLRRIKDLGLVVIDYLQLMTSSRKTDNRVNEVSEITRSLKIMAKELNVPVITLSQLSRGPEARSDHRPMLSDLRDSGSIEQDADIVLFLYREAYYDKTSEEQNVAECIIAKNRHGETASVKLGWDGQFTRFSNLELFRHEE